MLGGEHEERPMVARPILIKRYVRSRLYDPGSGRYVSIKQLRGWQRQGVPFVVIDVETGTDVTRVLLA
jgi:polyhydroxyalkanoate synthesis regulator protein